MKRKRMNPQESRDSFFFIMYGLFYDSLCNRLRKDGKISVGKILKNDSDLCTQTCPYRLAKLGTSLRVRGKLTLRKKAIKFLYSKNKNKEMTHTKKPSPLVGEGGGVSRRKGQV